MKDLITDIKDLIDEHYEDEFEGYHFKSREAEDEILTMIDDLKEEIASVLLDGNYQIECELNDCIKQVPDSDIIYLDRFRI